MADKLQKDLVLWIFYKGILSKTKILSTKIKLTKINIAIRIRSGVSAKVVFAEGQGEQFA